MSAYLIVRVDAKDPALLKDYQAATPAIVARYGGRFLARGGATVTLEGPTESRRIVIIEFPSLADAQTYYHSPEYTAAHKLREAFATCEFVAVEGVK
jgi:uncharacterized protein (DUF1330 family)